MAEKRTPALLIEDNRYCPGCGHGIINRVLAEVLEEMGLAEEAVISLAVGCGGLMMYSFGTDWIQAPHGRAAAVATGFKRVRPKNCVIAYQGDGDAYNIGIAETLNAAYRNENICVFVVNNNNFGMTGGQMSWCTMEGQKTATSPHGRDCALTGYPIKVPEMIAHSFKPAYVARGAITTPQEINKLKGYIRNAFQAQLNHEGYSLVEVLSTCPTNWAMSPLAAHKRLTEEVAPYYELGEFKKRGE